jgi:uncharacterized protein (UPF0303 family)
MTDQELLETLIEQERRLQFDRFDNDAALALGMALVERARADKLAIAVDITRTRQQLFHAALPGTNADNDEWIRRKTNLVYRFGHSSFYVGTQLRISGLPLEKKFEGVTSDDYAAHGGCFPVIVRGTGMVGTATVSGLPQAEDHRIVVETIERFLARTGKA